MQFLRNAHIVDYSLFVSASTIKSNINGSSRIFNVFMDEQTAIGYRLDPCIGWFTNESNENLWPAMKRDNKILPVYFDHTYADTIVLPRYSDTMAAFMVLPTDSVYQ